ncbi:MAG TPA: ParB/RepB/Spo0J family partition protein [Methylocella sp.]|jgi:ParB/RepB/Spo0J family partition protein|nr:ParB/RepB/Spo0J family partition protein [Methylocella sp.]
MKKNETRDNIALSDIHVSEDRLRKLDPKLVDTLAESMRGQGQLQPILVRHRRDRYDLISGRHRLEAAKKLNMRIRAEVNFNFNGDDMLLAEIDENLIRGELTPAEQAEHLVKRKEIYERKHPETKQHVAGGKARHGLASDNLSFASSTAEATGKDRRTVERGVARGEQSRLKEISGTSLDKGIELDALAKLEKTDPVKRDTIIDLAKAGEKVTARTPVRTMTAKQQAKPDNNISARRYPGCRVAEEIAEWAKKLDPKEAPGIVKLLLEQAREDPFSSDFQAMLLMSTWNAAGPEAQQEFMRRIK